MHTGAGLAWVPLRLGLGEMPEKRTMSCLGCRILTFFVASMGKRQESPSACLQCAHLQVVLQVATRITFCPAAVLFFSSFFFAPSSLATAIHRRSFRRIPSKIGAQLLRRAAEESESVPTTSKRIDKHKHLGAHEGTFCPLSAYLICQTLSCKLHVQGGKDQVREGLDWSTSLFSRL